VLRRLVAGTWSLYWNGLVDGARPRPSAWAAAVVQGLAGRLAGGERTPSSRNGGARRELGGGRGRSLAP
jgi:hypothetical protein